MTRKYRLLAAIAVMIAPVTIILTHWQDAGSFWSVTWLALVQAGLVLLAGALLAFAAAGLAGRLNRRAQEADDG
ncbi:MAG: hypothetical protein QOJ53_2337 [Sphingomonadales bacterium]|jgi:hypothetical protein|nr:hypothetical protein [Sphingomonadales bacterium]